TGARFHRDDCEFHCPVDFIPLGSGMFFTGQWNSFCWAVEYGFVPMMSGLGNEWPTFIKSTQQEAKGHEKKQEGTTKSRLSVLWQGRTPLPAHSPEQVAGTLSS
ncbi:MAG: hypothetical protein ACI4RA_06605, partial [Kiritimatiellia bacterium]